jgi:uncharacterized protein
MPPRALAALLLVLVALAGGCGGDDADRVAQDVRERVDDARERVDEARERVREARERLAERVRDVLEDMRQAVPEAGPRTEPPTVRGEDRATTIEQFLTDTIARVDRYWTRTLSAAGLEEPRVNYVWVPPNRVAGTRCGVPADDDAAFYCPADDTIYIAQVFALQLYRGLRDDFPGTRAGAGRAVGDFGVAYVVAHEYAHNVQQELGFYSSSPRAGAKPFELQADCMAGLWANSVLREGRIAAGDVEEAMSTASAAGDFDYSNRQHHGTPAERREAWLTGYRSGDPSACQGFVPT